MGVERRASRTDFGGFRSSTSSTSTSISSAMVLTLCLSASMPRIASFCVLVSMVPLSSLRHRGRSQGHASAFDWMWLAWAEAARAPSSAPRLTNTSEPARFKTHLTDG